MNNFSCILHIRRKIRKIIVNLKLVEFELYLNAIAFFEFSEFRSILGKINVEVVNFQPLNSPDVLETIFSSWNM